MNWYSIYYVREAFKVILIMFALYFGNNERVQMGNDWQGYVIDPVNYIDIIPLVFIMFTLIFDYFANLDN
jgi:ABC-type arginine transport system permease subunit